MSALALQDPSYPVYVDSSVIMGMTGGHNGTGFDGIQYMVCSADNGFFPDLSKVRCVAGWLLPLWTVTCRIQSQKRFIQRTSQRNPSCK